MTDVPIDDSIFIIWSSADPDVAHNAACMYGHNSLKKLWWGRVRFIIWGPSAQLATQDESIQGKLQEMMDDGVEVWACRACAENYDVVEQLENLGYDVRYVGTHVTEMLKSGWKQLTF